MGRGRSVDLLKNRITVVLPFRCWLMCASQIRLTGEVRLVEGERRNAEFERLRSRDGDDERSLLRRECDGWA